MAEPDNTREALLIFRDSLEPKLKRLLEHATDDDLETLQDRQVLDFGEGVDTLNLNDPIIILNLLQNLQRHRLLLFDGVADDFVLERITSVRRMRNNWAHFGPSPTGKSLIALRWLLEKSNDANACNRLDDLNSQPQQQRQSQGTYQVDLTTR